MDTELAMHYTIEALTHRLWEYLIHFGGDATSPERPPELERGDLVYWPADPYRRYVVRIIRGTEVDLRRVHDDGSMDKGLAPRVERFEPRDGCRLPGVVVAAKLLPWPPSVRPGDLVAKPESLRIRYRVLAHHDGRARLEMVDPDGGRNRRWLAFNGHLKGFVIVERGTERPNGTA